MRGSPKVVKARCRTLVCFSKGGLLNYWLCLALFVSNHFGREAGGCFLEAMDHRSSGNFPG